MSWVQKLYETYERCAVAPQFAAAPPLPIGHTTQQAHVEIVLDEHGKFRRATVVSKQDHTTLVPCTEESGGRAGVQPANHPLCDKLQYVGGDFVEYGGDVTSGFAKDPHQPHRDYVRDLSAWARSPHGHSRLNAILAYVQEDRLIRDLISAGVLPDEQGRLLKEWQGDKKAAPPIFGVIAEPEKSFVRWRVERPGDPVSGTWQDPTLIQSWIAYYASLQTKRGFCMVTGEQTTLAEQHPAKLRNAADKAKLISSNDLSGFTFRGRFIDADEACGVGFGVTQKAHSVLRWLINRQGYRNGDQVIVSWAVAGKPIPDPFKDSRSLFLSPDDLQEIEESGRGDEEPPVGDVGQSFAVRLRKAIAGYRTKLDDNDEVVVMALDSATPGRMAIAFYRELKGSEFRGRVIEWHERCAWHQDFGWDAKGKRPIRFIGAPSPADIAEAAFGPRVDAKLRKATVERLLPCIVDRRSLPRDLITSTVQRTSNRLGLERWQWEKSLGIACALYRGSMGEKGYSMTLEADRISRDYLYGRLLAVAEHIEGRALYVAGEQRDTTAARLMQRFADRPATTWLSIERALGPYMTRLRSRRPAFLHRMEQLLDDVVSLFSPTDFLDDHKLSGEYLLGYHCQRQALNQSKQGEAASDEESTDT